MIRAANDLTLLGEGSTILQREPPRPGAAPSRARVIAIGDIHGCSVALTALLDAIAPQAEDLLIPLGDVVDNGPDARGVVECLLALRDRCQLLPVMGNHEEMLLKAMTCPDAARRWFRYGGASTLDSYGFEGDLSVIPGEHVEFMRSFANYRETADHIFLHANYAPQTPLDRQRSRALRWTSLRESTPGPHMSGKRAIVGHSADPCGEILDLGYLRCIDTYCYGGFWLTAWDITSDELWQTNEQGQLRNRVIKR